MKKLNIVILLGLLLASLFFARTSVASFRGFLQEDTAATVLVGPFVQMASGNTPYTTNITAAYVFISKAGGAPAAKNDASILTASGASGYFTTDLDATDTSTPGILVMYVHPRDALLVDQTWQVMAPNPFGAFFGAASTTYLNTGIATSGVTVSDKAGFSLAADQSGVTVGGVDKSVTVATNLDKTGYTASTVSDKAGYSLAVDQSGVTVGGVDKSVTVATNLDKTGYSLAVDQSGVTVGGVDKSVTVATNLDKTGYSLAADQSGVTVGGVDKSVTVATNLDKTGYSLAVDQSGVTIGWISESGITAFMEHYLTGHLTENTVGKEIADGGAAGDPWSTAVPGAYGAGTAGYIIGTNLDTPTSGVTVSPSGVTAVFDHVLTGHSGVTDSAGELILKIKRVRP